MRQIEYPMGLLLLFLFASGATGGQDAPRIDPAGISGSIVFSGADLSESVLDRFVELAQGSEARIVVLYAGDDPDVLQSTNRIFNSWHTASGSELHMIRLGKPNDETAASVIRTLESATGVWVVGATIEQPHVGFASQELREAILALLQRDGTLGLHGVHPAQVSGNRETMPGEAEFASTTLGLFPNVIIDTISATSDGDANVAALLADQPSLVGIEVEQDAALVVRGRRILSIGEGAVRVQLAESPNKAAQAFELKDRSSQLDLVGLRRAALDRVGEKFPADEPKPPFVPNGTLIIIGGGGMPSGIVSRFVELAGGEDASIVVLPTAMPDPLPPNDRIADAFLRAGAKEAHVLNGRTLDVVDSPEYVEIFSRATGIWFGGGRQWRFVDAYQDTLVHGLMHDVLARGGVIMGSSAGASIQAEYMARGTPIGNSDIIADGYERGLGFLPGAAVDQHFAQRRRFSDMTELVGRYPQILGIGIDEATALIVTEGHGEIAGRGAVHFYDALNVDAEAEKDYVSVYDQGLYDLVQRVILEPGEEPKSEPAADGQRTRPPRPPVTRQERVNRYAQALMQRFDKNGDGFLDAQESTDLNRSPAAADSNNDGKISLPELKIWLRDQLE